MCGFNLNLGDFKLTYADSNTIRFDEGFYQVLVTPVYNTILKKSEFKIELFYKNHKCSKEFDSLDYALAYLHEICKEDKGIV